MVWQRTLAAYTIGFFLALSAETTDASAQSSIRKDLPQNALPKNSVTSFHRRSVDSDEMPWQAIGRVNIGGRAHCSGTLVAENIVLTAAHCLYSRRDQKMVVPGIVHFLAGYSKGEYKGHSKVKSYIVGDGYDGAKGAGRANLPHDWALLTLEVSLGEDLGFLTVPSHWFNPPAADVETPEPAERRRVSIDSNVTTAGYPGDRKHILSLEEDCDILTTAGQGRILFTSCVALNGDSGGPILQKNADNWHIIGVQTSAIKANNKISGVGLSAIAYQQSLDSISP